MEHPFYILEKGATTERRVGVYDTYAFCEGCNHKTIIFFLSELRYGLPPGKFAIN